jgi:hypothetical protein
MKRGAPLPTATLANAFRAYLESASLNAAAAAVHVHPKTLQRYARRERWKQRRADILRAVAHRTDAQEIERLATARLRARARWGQVLSSPGTREGLLAILRELLGRH